MMACRANLYFICMLVREENPIPDLFCAPPRLIQVYPRVTLSPTTAKDKHCFRDEHLLLQFLLVCRGQRS